jgi:hypothetical protein
MVLPFVPDRTVQTISPFLADSSVPRSMMETFNFSWRTVHVGPTNRVRPRSLPDDHMPAAVRIERHTPDAATSPSLDRGRADLARGRRDGESL